MRQGPRSADYEERTTWNVRDSDGTLVLKRGALKGGTAFTVDIALHLKKPSLMVDLDSPPDLAAIRAWADEHHVKVLNVAGPRESQSPGIYAQAAALLRSLLSLRK